MFNVAHNQFIHKRCQFLHKQPVRRGATILPFDIEYHGEQQPAFYQAIAEQLLNHAWQFHQHHHVTAKRDKNVSIGLIRMANIQPLIKYLKPCTNYKPLITKLIPNFICVATILSKY